MIRITIVREWVNMVQCTFTLESARPIDGLFTLTLVNPNRVIVPHEDELVLTLRVSGFSVWRILVELSSSANLLQMLT